jgi:acyl-CoA reductase-like NAD-dependent aldehyde dehydrogenase
LKPASLTPIGALIIGEILAETSLPKGAFSILPAHREGARLFTEDERLKLLSFTGSPEVGWALKSRAGRKKVVLELGGNAACIVDQGTDLEYAAERIIFGAFYQSGQSCISVQRVYVHQSIWEEMVSLLIEKTAALKAGDPLDEETYLGPIISQKEAARIEEWIDEATSNGAKLLTGGGRQGSFVDATWLTDVSEKDRVSRLEVFGPVAILEPFKDFKEAIAAVNRSDFGLQAGVFTQNINRAFYAWNELEVGGVIINDIPSMRVDSMPYGGVKQSGLGREGVRFAMEEMTELRLLVLNRIGDL